MRKVILLVFFFLTFIFAFPLSLAFADEGWVIDNFNSYITVLKTGEVNIVETIDVNFNNLNKHGIYRDIPVVYTNSRSNKVYTDVKINSVYTDTDRASYSSYRSGDFLELKIGNPNRAIYGKHSYVINYTVRGILRSYDDHDELYWNITGNNWEVIINKASAKVSFEVGEIKQIKCFEGSFGSEQNCLSKQESSSIASFETQQKLNVSSGLTIVVSYTKGLIPILSVNPNSNQLIQKALTPLDFLPSTIIFILTFFSGIIFIISIWWRSGRDFWLGDKSSINLNDKGEIHPLGGHETIVVEYTPPENLRPAEIGTLIDERADTLDVTATIIDLATRGFLTITEEPKKWLFGSTDYVLSKKDKNTKELLFYEKELLDKLFEDGNIVSVSQLKTTFYENLSNVKKKLYEDVQDKNLFIDNPEKVRLKYALIGVGIIAFGIFSIIISISLQIGMPGSFGGALIPVGLLLAIFSNVMPRRSAKGRELLRRVNGYKLFISGAEKYKQQFFEKKNMFNEILPYAIIFGLTQKFAEQMRDIGLKPESTSWYYGSHPFNMMLFSSSINNFSSSFSSAIASSPKSSGFSSGGGFSGGGFGGGGGGSW